MSAPPKPRPADELLLAIAAGDRVAFEELYRRYAAWLLVRLRRRCADPALAEEVVQETFLAVWRSGGGFRAGIGERAGWAGRSCGRRSWGGGGGGGGSGPGWGTRPAGCGGSGCASCSATGAARAAGRGCGSGLGAPAGRAGRGRQGAAAAAGGGHRRPCALGAGRGGAGADRD